jgi:hypothetical protein
MYTPPNSDWFLQGDYVTAGYRTHHDNRDAVEEKLHRAIVVDFAQREPTVLDQPPAVG